MVDYLYFYRLCPLYTVHARSLNNDTGMNQMNVIRLGRRHHVAST